MKIGSKIALAAALAIPSFAMAETPNQGKLTFAGGVDYSSNYYFRGYLQENDGLLFQPYLGMTAKVVDSDDFKLSATLATWNSIHTEKTLSADTGPSAFYESDLTGSLDATFGKFTLSGIYTLYMYPNGAFESIQEFGAKLGFDDTSTLIEGVAFKPYISIYVETDDGNGSEDTYGEVGITPGYTWQVTDNLKLPLEFPVVLGVSVDDYYLKSDGGNSFFGYGSVAVKTSLPLPIPEEYGNWYVTMSGTYTYLFADSVEASNGGEQSVLTGKIGINFAY